METQKWGHPRRAGHNKPEKEQGLPCWQQSRNDIRQKVSKRGGGLAPGASASRHPPHPPHGAQGQDARGTGRVCLVRASTCDTLKRGMWTRAALRVEGRGGTEVVPRGMDPSTPATAGCVGAA